MKKSMLAATLLVALSLAFTSCKKDDKDDNNNTPQTPSVPQATITINDPDENATFTLGADVNIDIDITCPVEMHGYEAVLVNETTGETVWSTDAHAHAGSYEIMGTWVNNVSDHSDMKLTVTAEIDHDGTVSTKSVHFHCHPM